MLGHGLHVQLLPSYTDLYHQLLDIEFKWCQLHGALCLKRHMTMYITVITMRTGKTNSAHLIENYDIKLVK